MKSSFSHPVFIDIIAELLFVESIGGWWWWILMMLEGFDDDIRIWDMKFEIEINGY